MIKDIGTLDEPVLVFGGPYSNLEATEALFARATDLGIPPERMICTGDVVAYCADPEATTQLVASSGCQVIMGNCEEALAADSEDCGCGFEAGSACDTLALQWYAYAREVVTREAKSWMGSLPRRIHFQMLGHHLCVVHGAPSSINRYVFESTPSAVLSDEIDQTGMDGVISGHSGLPFTRAIEGRLWHNAGVIGLPANDGSPRVSFSLLTPVAGGILIERHALGYDHPKAAGKMRDRGLPEAYATTLDTGLWDNCEILPAAETAQQGQRLTPESMMWSIAGAQALTAAE